MKFLIFCFIFVFFSFSYARIYATIDNFNDNQTPLVLIVANGGDPPTNYEWWSPYYEYGSGSGGPPGFTFFTTSQCLGGQRDSVLGYQSDSSENSVAVLSIVGDAASIAFPLNYAGGAYFQWDGDDAAGGANAFPGATLNALPGIGNGESIANGDNQSIDFTFGGAAIGMTIEIQADHQVFYFLDCIDTAGRTNTLEFDVDTQSEDDVFFFFFLFSDPRWNNNPAFDFTSVAAFQVRVFTFSDGTVGGASQAIDTEFRLLNIFGFEVSGTVVIDCLCDSIPDQDVENEQVDIFVRGNPTSFASAFTDVNGVYSFVGITPGNYTVCLNDQVSARCPTSPGCLDFELNPTALLDALNLDFFYTQTTTLNVPPDESLNCGDCSDPTCTGFATASGCGGSQTQISTWTETITTNGCVETIRRTWVDPDTSASGVQVITLTDSSPPVLNTPASDVSQSCDVSSTYQSWISSFGGATATDCSSFSFTVSTNSEPFFCDSETVTFTAVDVCGQSTPTTATYTVFDNAAPTFTTQASNDGTECNLKNPTQVDLNTWLSTNGGAVATDNCSSSGQIIFSNDFTSLTPSCSNSASVTFTATDFCGNFASTTASFTISDSSDPVISPQAANSQTPCTSDGSDNTAFQNWLSSRGGAFATDLCIADDSDLTWTNNFVGGSVGGPDTCSEVINVIFTVTDDCGFSAQTSAAYTISDNTPPSFTSTASNLNVQCDGSGNNGDFNNWISTNGGASAVDSCSSVTFSNDNGGAPTNCGEATTVTFSAVDSCGNGPIVTTASYTVIDNDPPFFTTLPQDDSTECDSTASSQFDSWLSSSAFASIGDDCSSSGLTITNDFIGNTLPAGCFNTAVVTFFGNDPCGNTSAGETASFTISDNTPPVISPGASDQSVQCDFSSNQSDYQNFLATRGGADATDVCGSISWTNDGPSSGPSGCNDAAVVTFTANDGCGNIALTTATFSVFDNTPPTLISNASDLTVECNGNGNTNDLNNWLGSNGGASATDNCGSVSFTNDFTALSGGCTSSSTVTFSGCDSCGFCVPTTATFTITDSSSPSIFPQAQSETVECDPSSNSNAFQDFLDRNGDAGASDLCHNDSLVWTNSFVSSPFGCDSEDVTFTVTDICGFSVSTTATFTILDSISPIFDTPPQDLTIECDGSGNVNDYTSWVSTNAGLIASDVCAITLTTTNNAPIDGPVGCGTQVVTFTVSDECSNSSTDTAVFQVVDTNPPSLIPAQDQTVECDTSTNNASLQSWLDSNGGSTASDICYGSSVTYSNDFVSLIPDTCGSSATVTFTARDPCGESAVTTATFTVIDTQAPVISVQASPGFFECNAASNPNDITNYLNNIGGAVASDSCSSFTWSNNFVDAPEECQGPVSVTFTATDLCGNSAITVGSVEIDDTIAPQFTNFPVDRTILCSDSSDPSQTGTPGANDACASNLTPSFTDFTTQEPDERFCPGDTIITRTWAVSDDCGNLATQDQTIRITIPSGECIPVPCPPCDEHICCESSLEPVPCNPVSCNPVPCISTSCDAVPCLPITCEGSGQTPIFDDDDDEIFYPPPVESPLPQQCEPVYIYVFDDDEYEPNIIPEETTSSSNVISLSVLLLGIIFMFMF